MELREFLAPITRWWWLIAAAMIVAMGFSLVAVMNQDPIYQTSTTLLIGSAIQNPNPDINNLYLSESLATTYADVAQREPVREGTMKVLGLTWLPSYVAQPVAQTQLLQIIVTDTDPARAQAVANELAQQLILQSPTNRPGVAQRQEFINKQLDDLEVKIQQTQNELDARQTELSNLVSARQIADVQNQIAALQNKLLTLRDNYASLLGNSERGAINSLTVIEPAGLPSAPVGPNKVLLILTAAVFGAAIAVGAAYLLEYLDNTLKSPEEIKRLTGLPVLTGIPIITGEHYSDKLVTVKSPLSPITESYRSLRTGIQFSMVDRPGNMALLISSPNPSEGKSITAANLAVVLAQAENRVLLIDADLRRPVIHRIFALQNRYGLTDLLKSARFEDPDGRLDESINQLVQKTPIDGLLVLTSGPIPPNPSELLSSQKNKQLLEALTKRFNYVIIDCPPLLVVTDAMVLGNQVDGVIVVIDADNTPKNQLKQCVDGLREANANLLGVVVNRLSTKMDGYYNYYSYYYSRRSGNGQYGYSASDVPAKGKRGIFGSTHQTQGSEAKKSQPKEPKPQS